MSKTKWLLFLAVVSLAILTRFADLGKPSLWDDEMHTVVFSARPLDQALIQAAQKDSNPFGFYFLMHYWQRLGSGEIAFRLPAAFFGVAAVVALIWLAFAAGGWRVALLAGFLAAIHPLSNYCSQEVRAHTAALTAITLASGFLIRLLKRPIWPYFAGYLLATAASLHLHYYNFFTIAAHFFILVVISGRLCRQMRSIQPALSRLDYLAAGQQNAVSMAYGTGLAAGIRQTFRDAWRGVMLSFLGLFAALALFAPYARIFAFQLLRGQPWRSPVDIFTATAKIWLYFAFAASPDRLPTFGLISGDYPNPIRLAVVLGICSLPLLVSLLFGVRVSENRGERGFFIALATLPFALLCILLTAKPVFDVRHVLLLMPPLFILAAIGLDRLFRRSALFGAVLTLLVVAPMAFALHQERHDPDYVRQDWRAAATAVCEAGRPGDLALAYHEEKAYAFAYYSRTCGLPLRMLFDDRVFTLDPAGRRRVIGDKLAQWAAGATRIWLIDYHGAVYDPLDETRRELNSLGFRLIRRTGYDRGVKRFAIDLFTRDENEARAAFSGSLDLTGAYHPGQLIDGWYPPGEKGAWTAAQARVLLRRDRQSGAAVRFYLHRPFYPGAVRARLLAGGLPVAEKIFDDTGFFELRGPLPAAIPADSLVEIAVETDPTFIPADVLPTKDRTPKGLLVQRVELTD
ncbi:MAG: hypothetical protein GX444_12340 [Myxococcales bacterium]|nr:hypothetical protein [Myxococcales bacterium]